METDHSPSQTKKTVTIFAAASFLHDVGSDMIFSVWPLFLTSVLGANMTTVGLIDGLGDAVVSLSQAVSGYLSDRLQKRKVFVWMGYLFGGIARIGYAFAPSWQWIIPFRILDRSGKIRGSPRDAIVSEISTQQNRGRHFGIIRTMDNLGAVCGIVLSIFLIERLGYRTIFSLATIPSILAVLLILAFVREQRDAKKIYKGIRLRDVSTNLKLYMLLNAFFALGSFSYSFLLLAASKGGFRLSTIPVFYLLFTLVAALSSFPAGMLADRYGRKPLLFASFVCWVGVLLGLIVLPSNLLVLTGAFALYGLHKGILDTSQRTLAAELAPKEFLASTLGGFQMVIGLCALPSSLLAGFLWDTHGMVAPFVFSLILTLIASFLLLFIREAREVSILS